MLRFQCGVDSFVIMQSSGTVTHMMSSLTYFNGEIRMLRESTQNSNPERENNNSQIINTQTNIQYMLYVISSGH